ncbi:ROK family protein [Spiroplasma endosymbiont of Othius punctulatus]|uniref:ROK family protein n=1 Tax=Spiroplasma endosymbiont of Othius punctulatus TaxID=3066289 RepID=UPI0030CB9A5F
MKALCIDIGGTSAKCVLFENDEITNNFEVGTLDRSNVLKNIVDVCVVELNKINVNLTQLDFIGIAVPCLLDMKTGTAILATNLGWNNYPVLEESKKLFNNKNVFVLNDASAATYGEWKIGLSGNTTSMALFSIGTGIGGGLVYNNKLVIGDNSGLASEPGHGGGFQTEFDCPCGLEGCIEPISSATGIERELNKVASKSKGALGELFKKQNTLKIIDIVDLFNSNDKEVIGVFNDAIEPLAKSISVTIHSFDIKTIVISGGVSNLGEGLIKILRNQLSRFVLPLFLNTLETEISALTNWVGARGVYEYGKDNFKK